MLVRRVWPSRPSYQSPFSDYEDLRRDMLRLFDAVSGERSREVGAGVSPPMNIAEDNDNFYVRAELPGIKASDVSVTALRNRLSISGKREISPEDEKVSYHRKERAEGSFSRVVTLPAEVDTERVEARYADGILTLKLPKAAEAKPRQIAVKA